MISAILIYGRRGEILSSRVYKDGLRRAVTDVFRAEVISNSSENVTPLLTLGSTSFLHIRHNSLFVVAVTRHDVDGIAVIEFLYKLCDVITKQLGSFDESTCYKYVSEIYSILDELVDFGIPQNTEIGTMMFSMDKENSISQSGGGNGSSGSSGSGGGVVTSLKRTLTKSGRSNPNPDPKDVFGNHNKSTINTISESNESLPWRRANIKHRRNEVFLDVIEHLNAVFDCDGKVLSASTDGTLKVKAALSGMPHCQVDLEHSEVLESSQLHACVDHQRFYSNGIVQFVPPEGEFELLRYRVSKGIHVPISIKSYHVNGEQYVSLRNNLGEKQLMNVVVLVPLPSHSTSSSHKAKSSSGKARFSPEKTSIEWKIGRVSSNSEISLKIHSPQPLNNLGPVIVNFSVDMYTSTRLKVRSLQVVEKYNTMKWVRYLTESGVVEMRMSDL